MGTGVEQHFRKEEISFLKQVEEWVDEVRMQYAPVLTNYLDPRQSLLQFYREGGLRVP